MVCGLEKTHHEFILVNSAIVFKTLLFGVWSLHVEQRTVQSIIKRPKLISMHGHKDRVLILHSHSAEQHALFE